MLIKIIGVLVFTFLVNLPFGWWRQGLKKFGIGWFIAIHLPIPLVILLRITLDIPYVAVPLVILTAIVGQLVGGKFRH